MKRLLCLALFAVAAFGTEKESGKIMDVKSTLQHFAPAGGSGWGAIIAAGSEKQRDTETIVDSADNLFTIHDERKVPCRFIVGDEVTFKHEKSFLTLRDTDNRRCRLQIVRQERKTK